MTTHKVMTKPSQNYDKKCSR